jgi:hypothetical protein
VPEAQDGAARAGQSRTRFSRALPLAGSTQHDLDKAIESFQRDLRSGSQHEARTDQVNAVSPIHVKRALVSLRRVKRHDSFRQFCLAFGSLLVGIALQLVGTALVSPNSQVSASTLLVVVVILILGLSLTAFYFL